VETLSQRFERIRAFYRRYERAILADGREWGMDPYAWDHEAFIRLTPIESAMWADIRAEDAILYPQYPVGRFFVDFGNPVAKVAVECDGAAYHRDQAREEARDEALMDMGWHVYHLTGRECFTDAQETEDDNGHCVLVHGVARLLIREICNNFPVRCQHKPDRNPWVFCDR
jgi:hypothetical protein